MTMQFAQHAPSNQREATDHYLHPSHYPFEDSIHQEIRLLKEGFEYIEITQEMITQIREESGNVKNYGDAVEEILYKELAGYDGMIEGHKVLDNIYSDHQGCSGEAPSTNHKKVFTCLFDSETKSTIYFLK